MTIPACNPPPVSGRFDLPITVLYRYQPPYWQLLGLRLPNPFQDSISRLILAVQQEKSLAIEAFARQLDALLPVAVLLCGMPGKPGIQQIIQRLVAQRGRGEGRPVLNPHLPTVGIANPDLIKNRRVLLLDDVIHTGDRLRTAGRILQRAGAQDTLLFALGQAR